MASERSNNSKEPATPDDAGSAIQHLQLLTAVAYGTNGSNGPSLAHKDSDNHDSVGSAPLPDNANKDNMSQTKTLAKEHLRLLAADEDLPVPSKHKIPDSSNGSHAVNQESRRDISLNLKIQVFQVEAPLADLTETITADKCRRFSQLRVGIVGVIWPKHGIQDYRRMTFRLEEDGHAAPMTITPTKIDAETPLPDKIYEGWYHRVQRGKQGSYKVDVRIDV
jgi:hypothetical protein